MKVKLISHTLNCDRLVASAAKICYSGATIDEILANQFDDDEVSNFISQLHERGHESPFEHVSFTFAIEKVSRALLAQVTRHRIASFSVQSQRYVNESNFDYVIPPEIEKNEKLKLIYLKCLENCKNTYRILQKELQKQHEKNNFRKETVNSKIKNQVRSKSCEDARFVLPNACCCKFILTMNARSLFNFFKLRCCRRAQWEIRKMAIEMFKQVVKVAPSLFKNAGPNCLKFKCLEKNLSCGLACEVKQEFDLILKQS